MPFFKSIVDGCSIYYQVYTPPVFDETLVFSHGWPMSSRMFDQLILVLVKKYRCVVYDRRGFGKSDWSPASWDIWTSDLTQLIRLTCPSTFVGIGSSMGCSELLLSLKDKDISSKCKGCVWLGPALPSAISSPLYPTAPTQEIWNGILEGLEKDRQGFIHAALPGVFGRDLSATESLRFETIIEQADPVALLECINILITRDFTEEIRAFKKPLMVIWGKLDQNIPLEAGPYAIQGIASHVQLEIYDDAAHGMYMTHAQRCVKDIEKFMDSIK